MNDLRVCERLARHIAPQIVSAKDEAVVLLTQGQGVRPGLHHGRGAFGLAMHLRLNKDTNLLEPVAARSGKFAPVCVLSPGIAVARDTMVSVFPFNGGAFSGSLRHRSRITVMSALKGGSIVTGSVDGEIKLWHFARPAFASVIQPRDSSDRTAQQLLSRSRDGAPVPVELWTESPPAADETPSAASQAAPAMEEKMPAAQQQLFIVRAGERRAVSLGSPPLVRSIAHAELASDGRRGVFCGEDTEVRRILGPEVSSAWVFSTDHPEKLSDARRRLLGWVHTGWQTGADCSERAACLLGRRTADHGWPRNLQTDGQVLPQAGMKSAIFSKDGGRLATWSEDGEVVVRDTAEWGPMHRFASDPLWNMENLTDCPPALSPDGRRLATAYDRAFVIWDVTSGMRISDPIYCHGRIDRLAFIGQGSARIEATIRAERSQPESTLIWDYADVEDVLSGQAVTHLRELAEMAADGSWITKAPNLAAKSQGAPNVIRALLEHFASEARVLQTRGSETGGTRPLATP